MVAVERSNVQPSRTIVEPPVFCSAAPRPVVEQLITPRRAPMPECWIAPHEPVAWLSLKLASTMVASVLVEVDIVDVDGPPPDAPCSW